MIGHLLLDAEAGLGTVEDEACLGKSLIAFRVDSDAIETVAFVETVGGVEIHLAAQTVLLQGLHAELAAKMARVGMVVAQEDTVLAGNRIIEEAIPVAIHLHGVEAHMAQQQEAIAFPDVETGVEVQLRHRHGVDEPVDEHLFGMVFLRFLEVDIDLAADGLVAVAHRRGTLGDRDAAHPGAGHIPQPKGRGQPPEVGHVFGHHLGIEPTQTEQLDLLGARDRIGVGHIDRGIRLEALGEAAASAATQGLAGDMLHMMGFQRGDELRLLTGGHLHLAQRKGRGHDMVVVLGRRHVVHGVVLIAHKTEHQAFVSGMNLDAIMAVLIGDRAHVGDLPIDIGPLKRLFFAVHFFVNGAFDDVLGKTLRHERQ